MYKKILVNDNIEAGRKLLSALSKTRFPITGAFWCELPDVLNWRLFIISPLVDREGPISAYAKVQGALKNLRATGLNLADISVLSPSSPEYSEVRDWAFGPGRMRRGPAFGHMPDMSFYDAYIYDLPSA